MSANERPVRLGDRVRIEGGRWDGNSGVVVKIASASEPILDTELPEDYALVQFNHPLEMVGGKLDSVGVPLRRCKT